MLLFHVVLLGAMGAQAEHERMFLPALPRAKAAAIDALAIGCVDKIFIEFLDAGAPDAADSNCNPSHSSNPVASQPQGPAAWHAPAAQNGCAGALHAPNLKTLDSPSTQQDRTVVAYQLLWRTDAARLGPLVGTSGGACASTTGGADGNAPKLWDSASSHLSGGAAAEVAPAAIAAGRPPRVAANGVEEEETERWVPPAASPDAPLTGGENGAEHGCSSGAPGAPPDAKVCADAGSAAASNGHSCSGGGSGSSVGAPAWIRGAYSLRLWGPEFLPERACTAGPGRAQPSTFGGCETPTDAGAPPASPCPHPGPQAQPVSDTAAALGTLDLEGSGAASANEQQQADGPAGSGTPRRRGGANALAALRDPPPAAVVGGGGRTSSAPCCAVMWITGSDAQAMEAASDVEVR